MPAEQEPRPAFTKKYPKKRFETTRLVLSWTPVIALAWYAIDRYYAPPDLEAQKIKAAQEECKTKIMTSGEIFDKEDQQSIDKALARCVKQKLANHLKDNLPPIIQQDQK